VATILLTGETRVWLGEVEITPYLRTGREPLALDGDRVVFADSRRPWALTELNRRAEEHAEVCP
jgi:hypothetical protein